MAHQDKDIRKAIEYAKSNGWVYVEGGRSHKKGTLFCLGGNGACLFFVYGTPRNSAEHAKRIRAAVDRCTHSET